MSHILTNNDLLLFRDLLRKISNNNIDNQFIENELMFLLPAYNNDLLIKFDIREKGSCRPMFIPKAKSIIICINKLDEWLDNNTKDFINNYNINDYKSFRSYLFLYLITHEIEHSIQYLMVENVINAPNNVIRSAYKGLFDLFNPPFYIIPRLISESRQKISLLLYKLKENLYLLERNANIESMDLICNLALFNNDEDVYNIFNEIKNLYYKCGYANNNRGSIEETYRSILMYDKYKKFYGNVDISDEDRVRYGFNINDNIRQKIFKK